MHGVSDRWLGERIMMGLGEIALGLVFFLVWEILTDTMYVLLGLCMCINTL